MENNISYTLTIDELLKRPIIRNDQVYEFMNKMTDTEISQWESEITQMVIDDGTPQKFPDFNAALMTKTIDRQIIYDIFKIEK